jgi:hypothetical protein
MVLSFGGLVQCITGGAGRGVPLFAVLQPDGAPSAAIIRSADDSPVLRLERVGFTVVADDEVEGVGFIFSLVVLPRASRLPERVAGAFLQ